MAAGAWQLVLVGGRRLVAKQFGQGGGPGLVKRCSQVGFYRFQIGLVAEAPLRKNAAQKLVDFPGNFLMDCSSRFFSWSVQPPRPRSTGRSSQILWLILTSFSLSSWKR